MGALACAGVSAVCAGDGAAALPHLNSPKKGLRMKRPSATCSCRPRSTCKAPWVVDELGVPMCPRQTSKRKVLSVSPSKRGPLQLLATT